MSRMDWAESGRRIKKTTLKVAKFFFTKDTATFLFFLCLAALFWLMYAVGTRREIMVTIPLSYIGIPNDVAVTNAIPQQITYTIKDEGQKLIGYYLGLDFDSLRVDLTNQFDGSGQVNYNVRPLLNHIQSHLPQSSLIINLKPEVISLNYVALDRKILPVHLSRPIPIAPQCVLLDSITIIPSLIEVYAPKSVLDTVHFVSVEPFHSNPLEKTSTFKKQLQSLPFGRMDVSSVKIVVPVEMSTEKTVDIPIQGVNFPQNLVLRTFPAVVKATFSVGLSRFNSISAKDFQAVVDYKELQRSTSYKVPVQASTLNPNVRNVRYTPAEVEFLLEKE